MTTTEKSGADARAKRGTGRKLRGPKLLGTKWHCDHGHRHGTRQQAAACNWRNRSLLSPLLGAKAMSNNVYANQADALEMARSKNLEPVEPPPGDGPTAADFPGSTPGPWRQHAPEIGGVVNPIYRFIEGGDGMGHAEFGYRGFRLSGYIHESDARLMAAAPELLALINRAVEVLQRHILPEGGPSDHDALCEFYGIFDGPEYRAAMAKATQSSADQGK